MFAVTVVDRLVERDPSGMVPIGMIIADFGALIVYYKLVC